MASIAWVDKMEATIIGDTAVRAPEAGAARHYLKIITLKYIETQYFLFSFPRI